MPSLSYLPSAMPYPHSGAGAYTDSDSNADPGAFSLQCDTLPTRSGEHLGLCPREGGCRRVQRIELGSSARRDDQGQLGMVQMSTSKG